MKKKKTTYLVPNNFECSQIILFIMAHSPPSTSGVLPEPICLLCGVAIPTTDELGMPKEFGKPKGDLKLDRQH